MVSRHSINIFNILTMTIFIFL